MGQALKDLKEVIIVDLNRDDLTDVVNDHINSVIRQYQRDFYYPNPVSRTEYADGTDIETVAGQSLYDVPSDMISVEFVRLLNINVWHYLPRTDYLDLLRVDVNVPSTRSIPTSWASFDSQIKLWATPDRVYPLELTGRSRIPIPATDDTENFWTTDARDLIRFAVEAQIYMGRIKDDANAMRCAQLAEAHRMSLVRETVAKVSRNMVKAHW